MLVKIRDIVRISSDNYNSKDTWKIFRYLDTSNLTENAIDQLSIFYDESELPSRAKQKTRVGDILVSSVRPSQKHFGYIEKKIDNLLVSTGFIILRPIENLVDGKYLFYYLSQQNIVDYLQDIAQSSKSSYPSITNDDVLDITINLPYKEKQKEITHLLSIIDKQIEHNNAMVKRLQILAQAIFNKWFIQFDFPNNRGNMVYNDIVKKEIPKGWDVYNLTECIKWESSSQPPKSTFSDTLKDGYIRFIQNRDYEKQSHITYIPFKSTTKTCNRFDIMMDKYGDAGRVRCGLAGAYNVALAKITSLIPFSQEYIRHFLMLDSNYKYLNNACMASTRASLNEQTLSGLTIIMPSENILMQFEKLMKKLLVYKFSIIDSSIKLNVLKDKLLPLLFNGQLQ